MRYSYRNNVGENRVLPFVCNAHDCTHLTTTLCATHTKQSTKGSDNMPDFTVRYAKKSELERVNEIRYQVNRVHSNGRPDIFRDDFCDEMKNIVYKVFENEYSDVIVAVNGDTICGFATVEYIVKEKSPYGLQRKFYRIAEFGVDENFRRMGVATKLINFCKQEAKNRGFDRLELDVWEFNEGAMKFYDSVGFKTYREYKEMHI